MEPSDGGTGTFATFAAAFVARPLGGLFFGPLGDRVGRRPVYGVSAAAMILLAVPSFPLIRMHGTWPPVLGVLLLATRPACFAAPSAATLPALFPTAVRYAAMGIGFNIAVPAGAIGLLTVRAAARS